MLRSFSSVAVAQLLLVATFLYLLQRFLPRRSCRIFSAPPVGPGPRLLPPGPSPWPVVGSLPEMTLNKPAFRWIHRVMHELGTDIACFRLGGVHVIPVTCPRIAREVLQKQDANFASRPLSFASGAVSGGYVDVVLAPFGEQWKNMRRVVLSEIVCPSRHNWLHERRAQEADNLTRYAYSLALQGTTVDVRHVAQHYCGNVIRRLVFGRRYFGGGGIEDGGPGPLEVEHVDASLATLGMVYAFCVSDYLPCLLGLDLDGHEKKVREALVKIDRLHDAVILERWRQWKSGERRPEEVEDFLDILISFKGALLSIDEVRALCRDIVFAAVDNPSNAVEWTMAEMVNRPELLEKAVEELDQVVGRDRLVQESDIPKLQYAKACIREAFRLHPVAPFNVPHVALADATVAGYHIPKGSHVMLSRVGLGRNPAVWPDPLRFDPERHLVNDDVALTENELRFISFSTGRRGCMAVWLGTAMSVMLFGRLLQGFTWSKPEGVEVIHLKEGKHDLFMEKPLLLHAEPRLPVHLYRAAAQPVN
ncbi:hypothetical protein BRADI_4g39657v3 [Brachypodium distachyon]|uniref:Tyrosine N-monooxygenase n=1 Tax=Brachypodium distachyon TaxID=15368 RepID=I1ITF1_BRADI|nr:hypothetical protein BRADI_4g39657v3 [Brachypodium distachyon]